MRCELMWSVDLLLNLELVCCIYDELRVSETQLFLSLGVYIVRVVDVPFN